MTECEKILARASGKKSVKPGEIIDAEVDCAMIHDNNAPLVMNQYVKINNRKIWAPEKIHFVIDHHSPSSSPKAAQHQANMRVFAKEHGINSFSDCGNGICHTVMLERGIPGKGQLIAGTDSHTSGEGALGGFAIGVGATDMAAILVTGKIWLKVPESILINITGKLQNGVTARDVINIILKDFGASGADYCNIEFTGDTLSSFDLYEKSILCIMAAEMGVKSAIIVDKISDRSDYSKVLDYDVSSLSPTVACPSLPTNVVKIEEFDNKKIYINQAAIGSCAGGGIKDLEISAKILKNRKINKDVRMMIIPSSRKIYTEAMEKGYISILHEAGAILSSPACGVCGAHDIGALAPGEVCIASTTRNMPGRMGKGGEIYLTSAATVAASAINGYISDPRKYL